MNSKSSVLLAAVSITLVVLSIVIFRNETAGSRVEMDREPAVDRNAASVVRIAAKYHDARISDAAARLLELAYDAASRYPLNPHVKNRSRAQEVVVQASLDLDQPSRALRYVEDIQNWRRGLGYADLAFHLVRRGEIDGVEDLIRNALEISEGKGNGLFDPKVEQAWRRDRIRVSVARAREWLDQRDRAAELADGTADSESGKILRVQVQRMPEEKFDSVLLAWKSALEIGGFDQARGIMAGCVEMYRRFHHDEEKRSRIEAVLRSYFRKVPMAFAIEVIGELADLAVENGDSTSALALVGEAEEIFDEGDWQAQLHVSLLGMLSRLRSRAGDIEGARMRAARAMEVFEQEKENGRILDIFRSDALLPVAEAYHAMGDRDAALRTYTQAVAEGAVNPNARPRADDLVAACCSMATHGFEPDAALWHRLAEIREGLSAPW